MAVFTCWRGRGRQRASTHGAGRSVLTFLEVCKHVLECPRGPLELQEEVQDLVALGDGAGGDDHVAGPLHAVVQLQEVQHMDGWGSSNE